MANAEKVSITFYQGRYYIHKGTHVGGGVLHGGYVWSFVSGKIGFFSDSVLGKAWHMDYPTEEAARKAYPAAI